jgi:hypothetical protein
MTNGKRMQRLKDLMKHRTTVEEGLTLYQVFCEVYPDIVEEYHDGKRDEEGVATLDYIFRVKYNTCTSQVIKRLGRTDDDFRWLSRVPCKDDRGKIKEYRIVNIKPGEVGSYGYNLLTEVNDFWLKHKDGTIRGLERARRCVQQAAYITEKEHDEAIKQRFEEIEMIQSGVIDDPDEYFRGKKTRLSIQKRKARLESKATERSKK